jgi:hypothetical protein
MAAMSRRKRLCLSVAKCRLKFLTESECFAATGKVVYELPNTAMGLAFEKAPLKSAALLREWLLKASGGSEGL